MTSNGCTDQACSVADPLSRLSVQGACESAVLSALGVMTRGQSRAQGGSAQGSDQGSEQPRQDAQSDSDMIDADAGQPCAGNADETMQGYDSELRLEPQQSESSIAGDGSGFKEQVCAAYQGDPNFVNSEFTKQLVLKNGIWFKDQALVVPKIGNLRQECMRELYDTPLSGHLDVTKTQKAVMRRFGGHLCDRMSSSMCLHVTAVKGQRARIKSMLNSGAFGCTSQALVECRCGSDYS